VLTTIIAMLPHGFVLFHKLDISVHETKMDEKDSQYSLITFFS